MRRKKLQLMALVIVSVSYSSFVFGQAANDHVASVPDDASLSKEQVAVITMNAFAACVLRKFEHDAELIAASVPGSVEQNKAVAIASRPACLYNAEMHFRTRVFRGAIFEQMYRRDYRKLAPYDLSKKVVVDYRRGATSLTPEGQYYVALLQLADCSIRKEGNAARDLILSPVAGTNEDRSFARLTGALGGCLSNGITVHFSRPTLRGAVAETLYSLTRAPLAVAGQTAAAKEVAR